VLRFSRKGDVLFSNIMVPVDLVHADKLDKALTVAANLAKNFNAPICYVGMTAKTPSPVARTPEEFAEKLAEFARAQSASHGVEASSKAYPLDDPAIEMSDAIIDAVKDVGADLVVMATHIPNVTDYVWASHGGKLASHSSASVMLVR
jgi:nucleotide-binding universal stress UspA family protein